MMTTRYVYAVSLSVWSWLFASLLVSGGLTGCAANGSSVSVPHETFTDSDEPESRKRATNRLKLAVLYFQDGKNNFALDEVKQAIQIDPNWFEPYGMRGVIYMQSGEYAPAELSFQKALSINPNSSDIKHNYGVLLCKMKRNAEGVRMFDAALADPGYLQRAKTWQEQANCQLAIGQKAEAETSFMHSYELDAGNPVTGFQLANLLFQRGELVRAQFYARRVNNGERASAESLWLGIKIERSLGSKDAQSQLEAQLRKRFSQSREVLSLERGAFNE
jgi:type IV pilus assembly protein PilF